MLGMIMCRPKSRIRLRRMRFSPAGTKTRSVRVNRMMLQRIPCRMPIRPSTPSGSTGCTPSGPIRMIRCRRRTRMRAIPGCRRTSRNIPLRLRRRIPVIPRMCLSAGSIKREVQKSPSPLPCRSQRTMRSIPNTPR